MIDVIVPVFRGLDETRACLESVWAAPVNTAYRLVVINDASPEPEMSEWLRSVANEEPILLIENEQNLGFVRTVNRGMALSTRNDVVLLNSDTEVAGNWLDRLKAAAYRNDKTCTVTPFSNNATICSYPRLCEDNTIPSGWNLAGLDALFANLNSGKEVEIPTAVGFCMYIRRDCLQKVGEFDAEAFGFGYGEENDFCMRALKSGRRHVMAEDVFIWHKGNVSFGDSHSERKRSAMETLIRKHPNYQGRVRRHIVEDPARAARTEVDWHRLCQSNKPLVVFVGHNRGGGTERHIFELVDLLDDRINVLLVKPDAGRQVMVQWINPGEGMRLWFRMPADYDSLAAMLREARVSSFHVHHTVGIPPKFFDLLQDLNVPWDFTAHDYYPLCPQITLTGKDDRYCGEQGESQCGDCLEHRPVPGRLDITGWREKHRRLVEGARRVFAPSEDTVAKYRRYFPAANVLAVAHPESERSGLPRLQVSQIIKGKPLRIAVIGAMSPIKGANLLEAVYLDAVKRKLPLSFRLFGYAYRELKTGEGFDITGEYKEADLPAMLSEWRPHLVWFPAQCPETYSYTLSTVLALGLPVVSTSLGAIAERIRGLDKCWVLDWNTEAPSWNDFFVELMENDLSLNGRHSGSSVPQKYCPGFSYQADYAAILDKPHANEISSKFDVAGFVYPQYGIVGRFGKFLAGHLASMRMMPFFKRALYSLPTPFQRRITTFINALIS